MAFPALLFVGVPPIPANATNTLALWTGVTASGGAYRNRLDVPTRVLLPLLVTGLAGGIMGAFLLLRTPAHTFMRVLPWLLLGRLCSSFSAKRLAGSRVSSVGHDATAAAIVGASFFERSSRSTAAISGSGMGIVNLAMLAAVGMTDIRHHGCSEEHSGIPSMASPFVFVVKGGDFRPHAIVADRRSAARRILWRPLCPEIASGLGARICDPGGSGDDSVLLCKGVRVEIADVRLQISDLPVRQRSSNLKSAIFNQRSASTTATAATCARARSSTCLLFSAIVSIAKVPHLVARGCDRVFPYCGGQVRLPSV